MKLHIYGALKNYKSRRPLRLHMPGHKAEKRLFGAKRSHLLTDGSTAGVYAMLYAAKKRGGKIAIARNSHKSVYNACRVLGIEPYLLKNNERDGILLPPSAPDVEEAFKKEPNLCGVLITSPDYFGNTADLGGIRKVCGRYGKLLLVDGAHGAYMRFDGDEKADYAGNFAQAWVDGAHKTLPALTQTALLHIQGKLADRERIRHYLSVYQSSSPSYVLMASIDACTDLLERKSGELFAEHVRLLSAFRESCRDLKILYLAGDDMAAETPAEEAAA